MSQSSFPQRDEYGVALIIFGNHMPDFFPLLGRVVALSSVVEYEVRATASRIVPPDICDVWSSRLSEVTSATHSQLVCNGTRNGLTAVDAFVQEATEFADRRAIYAHSLIPSVSLQSPAQPTAWRTKPGTQDLELGSDLEVLRADVRRGSELVERWNHSLLSILNGLPLLQTGER